jgi:hypothetical protein
VPWTLAADTAGIPRAPATFEAAAPPMSQPATPREPPRMRPANPPARKNDLPAGRRVVVEADDEPARVERRSYTWLWVTLIVLMALGGGVALGWNQIAPALGLVTEEDELTPFLERGEGALAQNTEAGYRSANREFPVEPKPSPPRASAPEPESPPEPPPAAPGERLGAELFDFVAVEGVGSGAAHRRVANARRGAIARCFQAAGTEPGRVVQFQVWLGPDGLPWARDESQPRIADRTLRRCLMGVLERSGWGSPEGASGSIRVAYRFGAGGHESSGSGGIPRGRYYDYYIQRGDELLERGDVGRARDMYEAALEAHAGLGSIALELDDARVAVDHFQRASQAGYADAFIGLGGAYRRLGQTGLARAAYQSYLDRSPNGLRANIARRHLEVLRGSSGGGRK